MTSGGNFWDVGPVWSFVLIISALFAVMLLSNLLIKVIKPLRKALIPAPVLGGFIFLGIYAIVKAIAGNSEEGLAFIANTNSTLELLTYHCLGIGFVASALKTQKKKESSANKKAQKDIFNASLVCVTGYLIQAIVGVGLSVALYFILNKNAWPASGLLVPMGFGQGPGQAFNWGNIYEQYTNVEGTGGVYSVFGSFANGKSFGLSIAAMGFVAASIGGIIYLNVHRRRGNPKMLNRVEEIEEEPTLEQFTDKNEISSSASIDKSSVQVGIVLLLYAISFGVIYGISLLCDVSGVKFLQNTIKPLFWGFNFIFGTGIAAIFKVIMKKLYNKGVVKKQYTNNYMMDRISGLCFDLMVIAAIGAIDLSAFTRTEFVVPLLVLSVAATLVSYFYVDHVCKKLYPTYSEESFLAMYGMLTGTASTGVILLREIDPQFKTPACNNMVFQMLWSIVLGAPMLLAMGMAARSWLDLIIWSSIFVVIFVVMYLLIRRDDFKKNKAQSTPTTEEE